MHPAVRVILTVPVLVFALISAAYSQQGSIRGTITDENGEPLIGANVVVKSTVLGAATNLAGEFAINGLKPGEYSLRISMIGYKTVHIDVPVTAGKSQTIAVELAENPLQTEEIVITAGKRAQSLEEVPVSISVMSSAQIKQRTLHRLDDALRYIPGVNMTESSINIRGSSGYSRALGSRVQVLVDGVPMLSGDAQEIKYDVVPMFAIDRIEVLKGSGSALYGSTALGGVINVITKVPRESTYAIRAYSGFYDSPYHEEWKWWGDSPRYFNGLDLQHGNALGDLSYLVGIGTRNNQAYRLNDDSFRWNANGKTTWKMGEGRSLSLSSNYASDERGNWVFWKSQDDALVPPDGTDLTETVISTKFQVSAEYREVLSDRFTYLGRVAYYNTGVDLESDTSDFRFRPNDRVQSTANSYMLQLQGIYALTDDDILTFGVDGTYNDVDALSYGKRFDYNTAIYAQNDLKIAEDWNISAGLRLDYTNVEGEFDDSQVNPRLGVSYTPWEGGILRSSFGLGFRSPSIAERYTSASAGPVRTKPNPDLEPEKSISYEAGIKQTLPFPMVLDLAVFYNEYENLVEPSFDETDQRIIFQNITSAKISGIEASLTGVFFDDFLTLSFGYTYMDPVNTTEDENGEPLNTILKYRPKQLFYANGMLQKYGFTLGVDFRYISEVENIDQELLFYVVDAGERVPVYVTDVRLSYDFTRNALPLRATLQTKNAFQYNYVEVPANIAPIRNYTLTLEAFLR